MNTSIDPRIVELTAHTAMPIIERGVKKISQRVEETESNISELFEILSRETTILCPEKIQKYSMIVELKKIPVLKKKMDFKHGHIGKCHIRPIHTPSFL